MSEQPAPPDLAVETQTEAEFEGLEVDAPRVGIVMGSKSDMEAMDAAAVLQGDERLKAYGEIDKMIVRSAAAVPFVWDKQTDIFSKNVNGATNDYNVLIDFNFTSLK